MSPETQDKIKIQWDDLKTRKVDQRLKEQEAVERNRRQAEVNPVVLTTAVPARTSIWYNSVFMMACFGLLGGLLAWGSLELFRYPDPRIQAEAGVHDMMDLVNRERTGKLSHELAGRGIAALKQEYADNPFFAAYIEEKPQAQKDIDIANVRKQQRDKMFIAELISFGLSGMFIAATLSAAEKIVDRNLSGALLNGFLGAAVGLTGGAFVSLFFDRLYLRLRGDGASGDLSARMLAHAVSYGVLGLFLAAAPGLMMRNGKKFTIGLLGGIVGGLVGGVVYDPIFNLSQNEHLSRLAALAGIGLFAGLGTGLIENAAKNGWLKVTAGLIAGKQFILYRNPTFIGSGPECPIYLFKDPQVGKRHAAIHIVPGGFDLENLPMGGDTLVNGKPVDRIRLKAGDTVQVGGTGFEFQEKMREKKG